MTGGAESALAGWSEPRFTVCSCSFVLMAAAPVKPQGWPGPLPLGQSSVVVWTGWCCYPGRAQAIYGATAVAWL